MRSGVPPLPPARMPGLRGGRPLKRWRYVGVFDARVMLCAGDVHVGPARQTFWAVWDRRAGRLVQRTRWCAHRHVRLAPGALRVTEREAALDLRLDEAEGVECLSRHGRQYAWTRKQVGIPARGTVAIGDRVIEIDGRAVVDDSAGYHARHTAWHWSAGVGASRDGRALAWNLVAGIHDAPDRSERALWLGDELLEPGPVSFAEDLSEVRFEDGSRLRFVAETERARRDNLLLLRSEYRQPFGTFSGELPGGVALASGLGVMERHVAHW